MEDATTKLGFERGVYVGLPWGPSGKTSGFQCRGPGFESLVRGLDPTCCNQEFTRLN